jgi:hypothetical protein
MSLPEAAGRRRGVERPHEGRQLFAARAISTGRGIFRTERPRTSAPADVTRSERRQVPLWRCPETFSAVASVHGRRTHRGHSPFQARLRLETAPFALD